MLNGEVEDETIQEEISLGEKYASFVGSSIIKVLIVRSVSLVYIAIFYRLISTNKAELGYLTTLSIFLTLIGNFSDLGLYYAFTQWTIKKKISQKKLLKNIYGTSIVIILPVSLILNFLMALKVTNFDWYVINVFLIVVVLNSLYTLLINLFIAYLEVNRINLLTGSYSVLTSITVPLFYYFGQSVTSVLWAWMVSFIASITITLVTWKPKYIIQRPSFELSLIKSMLIFGIPIYFITGFRLFELHYDRYVISLFYPSETLGLYTAIKRVIEVVGEAVTVFIAGLYPIFTKLSTRDNDRANIVIVSISKIVFLISILAFSLFFINRVLITHILIGENYDSGLYLQPYIIIGQIFIIINSILQMYVIAFEKFKQIILGIFLSLFIEILISVSFTPLIGVSAIIIAFIFGKLGFIIYISLKTEYGGYLKKLVNLRYYLFILTVVSSSFILDLFSVNSLLTNFILSILIILTLIMFKPLNIEDYNLISTKLPTKLSRFNRVIKSVTKQ